MISVNVHKYHGRVRVASMFISGDGIGTTCGYAGDPEDAEAIAGEIAKRIAERGKQVTLGSALSPRQVSTTAYSAYTLKELNLISQYLQLKGLEVVLAGEKNGSR